MIRCDKLSYVRGILSINMIWFNLINQHTVLYCSLANQPYSTDNIMLRLVQGTLSRARICTGHYHLIIVFTPQLNSSTLVAFLHVVWPAATFTFRPGWGFGVHCQYSFVTASANMCALATVHTVHMRTTPKHKIRYCTVRCSMGRYVCFATCTVVVCALYSIHMNLFLNGYLQNTYGPQKEHRIWVSATITELTSPIFAICKICFVDLHKAH